MTRAEQNLQQQVVRVLDAILPPPPDGPVLFAPDAGVQAGGKHAARIGGIRKSMGVRAGIPDLCLVWRGRAVFVELKTEKGRLSPAQREMHWALTLAGAAVTTCRSVDEVVEFIETLGIPTRGRVAA